MADEWEDLPPKTAGGGWEDLGAKPAATKPKAASRPMYPNLAPTNAGLASLLASVVGLPMDTVQNAGNLATAAYGGAKAFLTGDAGPDLVRENIPGGSENIKAMLRSTGVSGLNPDNPTLGSKMGTAQYDFVSRGGIVPGGALPAAGSMIAEKIGGPQWAPVGAMAPAAVSAAIPRPTMTPNKQILADEGVSMTPGQLYGGSLRRIEDAATSIPFVGDSIKGAQRRGIESFDAAAINRALGPIGVQLPRGVTGQRAVEFARTRLGDAYENLLPNLRGDLNATPAAPNALPAYAGQPAPMSFQQELNGIRAMGQNLPPPQRRQLDRIIANEVETRFTQSGLANGQTLKNIESELGNLTRDFRRSDNYDTRLLGRAVEEVQASMRRMIENVNPAYQGELARINEGYANFKKVQAAAASIGAQEGVFTPAQLQRAVRAGDTTKDKRAFSEGDALLQDLSQAGKGVLSQSVPDSGTPFRTAVRGAMAHPLMATAAGIPIAAGAAAYSSPAQYVIQQMLTRPRQPQTMQEIIQQAIIANQAAP